MEYPTGTGRRYIIGELERIGDNVILHYFKNNQDFKDAIKLGFKGYSIFDINQDVHDLNIMSTLERRIPLSQRTDFDDFLRYHRIEPNVGRKMSEFALLGYTGGKLPGDAFSFVHTFEEANIPCELTIDVAGARHYKEYLPPLGTLLGKQVSFQAEHENVQDPMAVAIKIRNVKLIGYVNRAQTATFNKWIANNYEIDGTIERINGTSDRPNILLYVKVDFK
jgi:hypothetical protein